MKHLKLIYNPFIDDEYWAKATLQSIKDNIKKGYDLNETDSSGYNALINACYHNKSVHIITELIKSGAEINVTAEFGGSALGAACCFGTDINVIIELVKNGANPYHRYNGGETIWSVFRKNSAFKNIDWGELIDVYEKHKSKQIVKEKFKTVSLQTKIGKIKREHFDTASKTIKAKTINQR